jgi:hypothetical protein
MTLFCSLFLDFQLPNAPTWFYLSLLLGVGLFFKFNRFLSIRNWDTITLFLLVPGLLLLIQAREAGYAYLEWYGYLWLLCGSGYFLVRCLVDLALVRRPHLNPNLNFTGLAWLACALFICLGSVAFRYDRQPAEPVGKVGLMPDQIESRTTDLVQQQMPVADAEGIDVGFWVGRSLAILCHLAVVAGLIFIGCRHFQDAHTGMAAATFYLLLPYTAYHIGQWHHVLPMALIVWAVGLYRRPMLAGLLLGLAAGTVYFPVLIFPLWLSFYWRRGAGRFAGTFVLAASVCMGIMGSILLSDGDLGRNLQSVLSLADWQPWIEPGRESPSFWTGVHWAWAYRMPVFIAYLAFLGTTVFWPYPKNLAHVLALSAALLVGIQFWYAEQGGVYVLWYLPLLLLLVFRPNLSDRQPPAINPETDWLCRVGRWLVRSLTRLLVPMEPVKVGR